MRRYSLVFTDSWIPTVEIRGYGRVEHRSIGFTRAHAFDRAVRWSRNNGDAR